MDGSEVISGDIDITGQLDPDDENTSCGIVFRTVSKREETAEEDARKARVIAEIKGRDTEEEGWGVHSLTFKSGEEDCEVHFLGNEDADLSDIGGEESKNSNVIGSDYIKVDDETEEGVKKRKVEAKILTGATPSEEADEHALITNDTVQKILAKKTFTDASGAYTVVIDGSTGKVTLT